MTVPIGDSSTSALEILDATDMAADAVAVVDVPVRIPVGFHGNWIPDRALS